MERLDLDEEEVADRRASVRQETLAIFGEWAGDEDSAAREGPVCPGSALKLDDVVQTKDGGVYCVLGPAEGRDYFIGYGYSAFGLTQAKVWLGEVVDRVPADPAEAPMPIWAPPPETVYAPPESTLDLEALRAEVIKQVDVVSTALIRAGFVFEGIVFSMSNEAQIRYLGMQAEPEMLPYPLPINSKDDSAFLLLTSEDHTRSFCRGAKLHVMSVVATGTLQKSIVRGLQTAAELLAYRDPRADALLPAAVVEAEDEMAAEQPALAM